MSRFRSRVQIGGARRGGRTVVLLGVVLAAIGWGMPADAVVNGPGGAVARFDFELDQLVPPLECVEVDFTMTAEVEGLFVMDGDPVAASLSGVGARSPWWPAGCTSWLGGSLASIFDLAGTDVHGRTIECDGAAVILRRVADAVGHLVLWCSVAGGPVHRVDVGIDGVSLVTPVGGMVTTPGTGVTIRSFLRQGARPS